MSESEEFEDESAEESPLGGESPPKTVGEEPREVIIQDKILTFEEASKCLNILGKDESCMRYAYLRFTACDQKLTDIKTLLNFRHVLFVDVSGNYLQTAAIQAITGMPFMVQLHAQRNFIDSCDLNQMCYLQDLSLARNRIRDTIGVVQSSLEYLDLNYNQIYQSCFRTEDLPMLKELEMRGNLLFELSGSFPVSLEKLYLAANKIARIVANDVAKLENLTVLHLRNNLIHKLDGFSKKLKVLKYLNLRENKINKLRQFRKLQCLPALETLIISGNPVSGDEGVMRGEDVRGEEMGEDQEQIDPNRVALLALLPDLKRINKIPVAFVEREQARLNKEKKIQEIMADESSEDEVEPLSTTTDFVTAGNRSEIENETETAANFSEKTEDEIEQPETEEFGGQGPLGSLPDGEGP